MTTLDDNSNQLDLNLPGLGPDTIFAGAGADFIRTATLGGSLIFGQRDNDTIISVGPNDTIYGGDDEDSIRLQRTPAYAYGDAGADTIVAEARATMYGGAGDDFMQGTAEANFMLGNEGNDIMLGGSQRRDTLRGGKGNDSIGFFTGVGTAGNNLGLNLTGGGAAGNEGSNFLAGDLGNDLVVGINAKDTLYGGKGMDSVEASGSNSYLSGDDDNDTLEVFNSTQVNQFNTSQTVIIGLERTTLLGGAGDDSLDGPIGEFQRGKNFFDGGDGNDTILSYAFQDSVLGNDGNDLIMSVTSAGISSQGANISSPGYAGQILLDGGRGNDTIKAAFATDTMIGGEGDDSLGGIFNQATGGDGNDTIDATGVGTNAARITLDGGAGNDRLLGNVGTVPNFFNAGSGNDFMVFGSTGDTLIGDSAGNDTISYSTSVSFTGTTANVISDFLGNNSITGGQARDSIAAGSGNDILIGGRSTSTVQDQGDTLSGGDGDDQLFGEFGDDNLIGGNGNDTIFGGPGADTLTGGSGNDTFYYANSGEGTTAAGSAIDGISDFVVGSDKIAISKAGFNLAGFSVGGGIFRPLDPELVVLQNVVATGTNVETNSPTTGFLVYEALSGNLYFDTNAGAAGGLVPLANLNGRPNLAESDIVLF
ncbi:Oscillin [Oscillatoriales cyanobacterium USR001]|nr:Oscillin [Oscillatoriales cyanobacterium USR001]